MCSKEKKSFPWIKVDDIKNLKHVWTQWAYSNGRATKMAGPVHHHPELVRSDRDCLLSILWRGPQAPGVSILSLFGVKSLFPLKQIIRYNLHIFFTLWETIFRLSKGGVGKRWYDAITLTSSDYAKKTSIIIHPIS